METLILLGLGNKFTPNTNKWIYILTGILFIINGLFNMNSETLGLIGIGLGLVTLFFGLAYTIYGYIAFSKFSKYAPRVLINNDYVELKSNVFKSGKKLVWTDIKKIEFRPYFISFSLSDSTFSFSYITNSDTSMKIKELLRSTGENKNIEIIGG